MTEVGFWGAHWFPGLLIDPLLLMTKSSTFARGLQRWAYDYYGVAASNCASSLRVALIGTDDRSSANTDRRPPSQDINAEPIALLASSDAYPAGHMPFVSDLRQDSALKYFVRMMGVPRGSPTHGQTSMSGSATVSVSMAHELDVDRKMSAAIASSMTVTRRKSFQSDVPGSDYRSHPRKRYSLACLLRSGNGKGVARPPRSVNNCRRANSGRQV